MSAFDLKVNGAGRKGDDFVVQNFTDFRKHFSRKVLFTLFHASNGALGSTQSLGQFFLGKAGLFTKFNNEFANFFHVTCIV